MLNDLLNIIIYGAVLCSAAVVMFVCVCVGNQMSDSTCDRIRWAYAIIFTAAVAAVGSLFIRTPTIIETLSLTGLAGLFLFDRRRYYGSDNENSMQNMQMAEKDS